MRIMLDTNIFISMIFFPSEKMQLLKTKLSKYHRIVICSYVIDELSEVIKRKFSHKQKLLDVFGSDSPIWSSMTVFWTDDNTETIWYVSATNLTEDEIIYLVNGLHWKK